MPAFDAIILTGGTARRLNGADKPALLVGGEPMVGAVARAVAAADRLIVVGPAHPALRPAVVTREDPPGSGPAAAIAAGLEHVRAPYVAVLAGDLPFLRAGTIAALLSAVDGHEVAVVRDAGGRSQWLCALWSAPALRRRLAGDPAGRSMRSVYAGADVVPLDPAAEPPVWFDVDTHADLARARAWANPEEPVSPTLPEWVDTVSRELNLTGAVAPEEATRAVLDLAREVAHGVARPAAPVTAFLLGVAVGRGADLAGAAEQIVGLLPESAE
ncbi:MAG TPA: NTP transferase domain-containing protein [Mycobacteriales bacterium]|nr:NTP transferase domain-containing protein [Mycobacteriales bacterium]